MANYYEPTSDDQMSLFPSTSPILSLAFGQFGHSVHKTATRVPGVQLNEDNTEVYDPYSVNNHPVPSLSNPEMGTSHSQFMVKDTYISVQANNIYFCSDPTISVLK